MLFEALHKTGLTLPDVTWMSLRLPLLGPTYVVIQAKTIKMLESEIKTPGICGDLSQTRRCQDFGSAKAGSSASLPCQITLCTAQKPQRRDTSSTAA